MMSRSWCQTCLQDVVQTSYMARELTASSCATRSDVMQPGAAWWARPALLPHTEAPLLPSPGIGALGLSHGAGGSRTGPADWLAAEASRHRSAQPHEERGMWNAAYPFEAYPFAMEVFVVTRPELEARKVTDSTWTRAASTACWR